MTPSEAKAVWAPQGDKCSLSTVERGINVIFPVGKGLRATLISLPRIYSKLRVSHCSLNLDNYVLDYSWDYRVSLFTLQDYYRPKFYIVSLPQIIEEEKLKIYDKFINLSKSKLPKYNYYCHGFVKELLVTIDTYSPLKDKTFWHPIDLLWELVENYNGSLRRYL